MASKSTPPSQFAVDVQDFVQTPSSSAGIRPTTCNTTNWEVMDDELKCMLAPVTDSNLISTTEAANSFSSILHEHLHTQGLISMCMNDCGRVKHHDNQLVKISRKLAVTKNNAKKCINLSPRTFLNAVRKIIKLSRRNTHQTSIRRQEKAFKNNPWQ